MTRIISRDLTKAPLFPLPSFFRQLLSADIQISVRSWWDDVTTAQRRIIVTFHSLKFIIKLLWTVPLLFIVVVKDAQHKKGGRFFFSWQQKAICIIFNREKMVKDLTTPPPTSTACRESKSRWWWWWQLDIDEASYADDSLAQCQSQRSITSSYACRTHSMYTSRKISQMQFVHLIALYVGLEFHPKLSITRFFYYSKCSIEESEAMRSRGKKIRYSRFSAKKKGWPQHQGQRERKMKQTGLCVCLQTWTHDLE